MRPERPYEAPSMSLQANPAIIEGFPFCLVRDYPIFPLEISSSQTVLAVAGDLDNHVRHFLDFVLCTEVVYRTVSPEDLDDARTTYYGFGVTCKRCPFCSSADIAQIIWNLAFDEDPRCGDRRYQLADNYIDGRGHAEQQNKDPRWLCRTCNERWGWKQIQSKPCQPGGDG
jgi:hypothetical protein